MAINPAGVAVSATPRQRVHGAERIARLEKILAEADKLKVDA